MNEFVIKQSVKTFPYSYYHIESKLNQNVRNVLCTYVLTNLHCWHSCKASLSHLKIRIGASVFCSAEVGSAVVSFSTVLASERSLSGGMEDAASFSALNFKHQNLK